MKGRRLVHRLSRADPDALCQIYHRYKDDLLTVAISLPIPEPIRLVFPARDMVVRLWIDVETSLPVGFDVKFDTDRGVFTGFEKLHCEFRAYDTQWNAELPDGIFVPNIPDDYTEFKITDFISTKAKAGLVGLGMIPVGLIVWKKRRRKRISAHPSE